MPVFATNPTAAVFDYHVFDFAFDIADIIPSFNLIVMEREYQDIEADQAVSILASIQDVMSTPGQRYQFDPTNTPQIQIYDPLGAVKVAWIDMNFVDIGLYNYQHQSLTTDLSGTYTAQFKAINGTMTALTSKIAVFTIL